MTEWHLTEPGTLTVAAQPLRVRLFAGQLDVIGVDPRESDESITIEVTRVGRPLIVRLEAGLVLVGHDRVWPDDLVDWVLGDPALHATVAIRVPADLPISLQLVAASTVVSGMTAPVRIRNVSGSVVLDGLSGEVNVSTVSGDVESRGPAGPLRCTTVSGDLTIVAGTSEHVSARAISGRVSFDLELPGSGSLDVANVSGDVAVRLPSTAGADVDLKTMSGGLGTGFDELQFRRRPGRSTLRGRLGAGGGTIRAATVSGDVALLRREPA